MPTLNRDVSVYIVQMPTSLDNNVSILWHLFGGAGCILFASRFWIQWLEAEKSKESKVGKKFWIISIIGSLVALIYFLQVKDWISSINYSFGLIPYIRNLVLSKMEKTALRNAN